MDVGALAASLVGARMGQVQKAVAADMLRINAKNAAFIVKVIEDAQKNNIAGRAHAANSLGVKLDVSV